MAKARNYLAPSMVVHQSFVDDASTAAVPALVHISGPHANFIAFGDDTESLGHIGKYDRTSGLHLELPRILAGNVLDLESTKVTLRDAALKYFSATTESFVIPAGSRNIIEASQADQEAGFSFKQNGEHNRSLVFGDRDVRIGDTVHVTNGSNGGEIWTSVAGLTPRIIPGEVEPATADIHNAETAAAAALTVVSTSSGAPTATASNTADLSASLLSKGFSTADYTVECIIGGAVVAAAPAEGAVGTARFRITAAGGVQDVVGSAAAAAETDDADSDYKLIVGTLEGAEITFEHDAVFNVGDTYTVHAVAAYTAATPTASGEYNVAASQRSAHQTTYIVTVTQGGEVPATEPTTTEGKYAAPTLSVITSDGSDKTPVVRVLSKGTAYSLSRAGITITVDSDYLVKGDKFYIVANSPFTDIVPALTLNTNIPADWIDNDNATPVNIELFISVAAADVPSFILVHYFNAAPTGSAR